MASGPETDVKIMATGLAAGILLDATVIRALIVPGGDLADGPLELVAAALAGAPAAGRALARLGRREVGLDQPVPLRPCPRASLPQVRVRFQ